MNNEELINRIEKIEARNRKVELDKAWEGSFVRRLLIVLFTYISIGLYMWIIGVEDPFLNAVIPSLGFTLSTLTLPFFKNLWMQNKEKK